MSITERAPLVGGDVTRIEAPDKVTGAARYAADHRPDGVLHATLVGAPVAKGTVTSIDASAALAIDGVERVLTHRDMPRFGAVEPPAVLASPPMQGPAIRYEGEPVAIVLATSLEAAEEARAVVRVSCDAEPPVLPGRGERQPVPDGAPQGAPFSKGGVDAALERATVRLEETYVQPARHHNAMETSCVIASWEGDRLTLWDSVQASSNVTPAITAAFGIDAEDLEVHARHVGGGFGAKAFVWPHEVLAAAAARVVGRPVKLALRRADQYVATGYQAHMTQTVELGADADGRLSALRHRASHVVALAEPFVDNVTETKALYACPNIETSQEVEPITAGSPTAMRAPLEGCGLWALESAMNELAERTGLDPLELRRRNYADVDPVTERPWSSKKLDEAYAEGARRFGWHERHDRPRRDGHWHLGYGMATSSMGVFRIAGSARVRLTADGAIVESNFQDIGTGLQTVLAQIAADELGLGLDQVSVRWGDSQLPVTGPVFGSSATIHTGSATVLACRDLKAKLAERSDARDPLEALAASGEHELVGVGAFGPPGGEPMDSNGGISPNAMRTFGAIFLEVGVDPELGLVRLRRATGAYSVGRIMNARTARAQMIGALTWGWGKATMEQSVLDPGTGRWLSKNLSGVHVPVNADIPSAIDIHFVDEFDPQAGEIGGKGIGELGATGVDAAVAAAVHDAVGVRIRELPITPARLLDALAARTG